MHAMIDVVEWNPSNNDVLAYKYPESNLSTYTQLLVRESQEAVLFAKGQLIGKFGPGKHTLTTENIPVLRDLFGIPFGGKNPFIAEVWFVNKTAPLNIDWKTSTMRFVDPDYGQMVPLIAKGRYGLKIENAEKFLIQLVGTLSEFTAEKLTDHFMGALISKTNSSIMSFMNANKIGINFISSYLDDLSNFLKEPMSQFWSTYGFILAGFYVTEVNVDSSTQEGASIIKALSERSAQGIAGYTWQQKQGFDVAKNNTSIGILGVAMMTGAFANGNGVGNAMMQPQTQNNNLNTDQKRIRTEVFCSNCGKKYPTSSKFCPFCGDIYYPCPVCGTDNEEKATRCVSCGTLLNDNKNIVNDCCSKCGSPIAFGTKFCPNCGNKLF